MITLQLPGGSVTSNEEEYVDSWRKFGRPVAEALGGHLVSYDPGLLISLPQGKTLSLEYQSAKAIRSLVDELAQLKERPNESEGKRISFLFSTCSG